MIENTNYLVLDWFLAVFLPAPGVGVIFAARMSYPID
jgi:hypothetical protein